MLLMIVAYALICGGVYLTGGRKPSEADGLLGIFILLSGLQVVDYVRES